MATIIHEKRSPSGAYSLRVSVNAGETSRWFLIPIGILSASVSVQPGISGEMLVEASTSHSEIINADNLNGTSNAIAIAWPNGIVDSVSVNSMSNFSAVRFSAINSAGIAEVLI